MIHSNIAVDNKRKNNFYDYDIYGYTKDHHRGRGSLETIVTVRTSDQYCNNHCKKIKPVYRKVSEGARIKLNCNSLHLNADLVLTAPASTVQQSHM